MQPVVAAHELVHERNLRVWARAQATVEGQEECDTRVDREARAARGSPSPVGEWVSTGYMRAYAEAAAYKKSVLVAYMRELLTCP